MSSDKIVYKLNISGGKEGPGKGQSKLIEIDEKKFRFEGMKIGDSIKGGLIGFPNYEFIITGGSDRSGFPMRKDVYGAKRKKILITDSIGFHAKRDGQRKRRMIAGRKISQNIVQLNFKITQRGVKPVEEILKSQEGKE